jgi:acetylornithine deacetylase/succinyl-diaminopimelate desuccinylase-like protein
VLELINKKINDTLIHVEIVQESPKQFTTGPEYFYNYLIKAIQHSFRGSEVVPILLPASTDNSYFRASGCPVYGLNPMIMSQKQIQSIHNFDEFIDLEDIDKGIDVFENFLRLVLFPVTPG